MTHQTRTMTQRIGRALATALLAITLFAPAYGQSNNTDTVATPDVGAVQKLSPTPDSGSRSKLTHEQIAERLKHSTCLIQFSKGKLTGRGTGWVVDPKRRLIVTNHHIVDSNGPADRLDVYFPVKVDGKWVNKLSYYQAVVTPAKATVIATTREHDLALLQLDRLPANAKSLKLAADSPAAGSQLHSLGGMPRGTKTMWIYSYGRVRSVGERPNAYGNNSRMVETQLSVNKGNSGGPIVNDFAEVVAVVEGGEFDPLVKGVTYHVDVRQLKSFLKTAMPLVNPKSANAYLQRGEIHMSDKRYLSAVKDFSAAIRLDPNSSAAFAKRGMAFLQKGDRRTSLEDFNQAIQIDPATAEAYYGRGMVHHLRKQYDDAVKQFTSAIRYEPTSARYYNMRGIAQLRDEDVAGSYQDFIEATKLNPKKPLYHANRGYSARLLGRHSDAVGSYAKAIDLGDKSLLNYVSLGRSLSSLKQYDKALRIFVAGNDAYKKRTGKSSWQCYYHTGETYYEMKEFQKAYGALSTAAQLNPNNADIYALRGLVAKKFGDKTKAKANLEKAAKLDPKKYAKYTQSESNATSATSSTSTSTTQKTKSVANSPVIGKWKAAGTTDGTSVAWIAIFAKDGSYGTGIVVVNSQGRKQTTELGRFTIEGNTIVMVSKTGKRTSRRFAIRDGKLGMYLPEYKRWLFYTRQP